MGTLIVSRRRRWPWVVGLLLAVTIALGAVSPTKGQLHAMRNRQALANYRRDEARYRRYLYGRARAAAERRSRAAAAPAGSHRGTLRVAPKAGR